MRWNGPPDCAILTLVLLLGVPVVATLAWYHGHRAQHRVE